MQTSELRSLVSLFNCHCSRQLDPNRTVTVYYQNSTVSCLCTYEGFLLQQIDRSKGTVTRYYQNSTVSCLWPYQGALLQHIGRSQGTVTRCYQNSTVSCLWTYQGTKMKQRTQQQNRANNRHNQGLSHLPYYPIQLSQIIIIVFPKSLNRK